MAKVLICLPRFESNYMSPFLMWSRPKILPETTMTFYLKAAKYDYKFFNFPHVHGSGHFGMLKLEKLC